MIIDVNYAPIMNMEPESDNKEEEVSINLGVDFSAFTKDGGSTFVEENTGKKKGRPSKKASELVTTYNGEVLPARQAASANEDPLANNPYMSSFARTNALLEGAILQTDQLSAEIKGDIDEIRASKTIKNKFTYLTNMSETSATLISTKINAIKELNKTIVDAHKLELDHLKAARDAEKDQTDEGRMMDLYKSFVNTPIGSYTSPNVFPSVAEGIGGGANITGVSIGGLDDNSQLTPEQVRMRMESDPNIMTVIRFNQETGERRFDVINKLNGGSIPNYPRPDAFLLEDTIIDVHAMSARNKNLDIVWPLVLDGSGSITEY